MHMELRHLRYFLSIVRIGSFTRAADELCITQPTLSHQIRQLEEQLGCELLDRSARRVRLTNAGEIFSEYANRAIKEVENGKSAIQEFQGLRLGTLSFGVISSFINSLLPPVLSKFQAEYPGIQIKVLELPTGELERQVREGELSFGLVYGPAASGEHMQWEELFREELAFIISPANPLAKLTSIDFELIAQTPLALLTREYISRRIIDAVFLEKISTPKLAIEMNSIDAILKMVSSSTQLGAIQAPRLTYGNDQLISIPIFPAVVRSAGIVTRQGINLSPAARIVIDMMRKNFLDNHFSLKSKPFSNTTTRVLR
jgi:LysR family transcriptional regulator, cyn operon transcriptional activator